MASRPKYYWDACAWISLIKRETGRYEACRYTIELAESGKAEIWTSAFTLVEVYKRRCDVNLVALDSEYDKDFEDYIERDFVQLIQVDVDVGTAARRILRAYPDLGKPQDAIHVATALLSDVDELHTFDRQDLLNLSGVLERNDGQKLRICPPPTPPPPAIPAPTLFDRLALAPPAEPASEPPREQAEG